MVMVPTHEVKSQQIIWRFIYIYTYIFAQISNELHRRKSLYLKSGVSSFLWFSIFKKSYFLNIYFMKSNSGPGKSLEVIRHLIGQALGTLQFTSLQFHPS